MLSSKMIIEHKNNINIGKIIGKMGMPIAFIAIFIAFSVLNENFLTPSNIQNIIVQSAIIGIVAVGQTLVILTGGIDLSVGSIVAFIGIICGIFLNNNLGIPYAVILSLLIGALFGLFNGVVTSYGKVPSFIVTLGIMSIIRGAALFINNGKPVSGFSEGFQKLANTNVFASIPIFVIYLFIIYGVIYFILNYLPIGRYIYAVGGNKSCAWLSGISVKKVETLTYVLSGLFAAFAGIMLLSRMNYGTPTAASDYNTDSIAAVIIGGCAMSGGRGSVIGTFLGAIMMAMLKNGLTLLNVSTYLQQIITGVVIILAVFIDKRQK